MLFFLIAIVLEVEKKRDRRGPLRRRALHCPHTFVLSVSHWMSARAARERCYSALKRRAQGFAEVPGSRGTGRLITATAEAQRSQ